MLCDTSSSFVYVVSILNNTDANFPGLVHKQWITEDENVAKNLLINVQNGEVPDLNIRYQEMQKLIEKERNNLSNLNDIPT